MHHGPAGEYTIGLRPDVAESPVIAEVRGPSSRRHEMGVRRAAVRTVVGSVVWRVTIDAVNGVWKCHNGVWLYAPRRRAQCRSNLLDSLLTAIARPEP